ncbi:MULTISPECIES: DUF29 domain-containing protein [Pseudanabaena]|uniref:DUF29 domain-containing protein n=1 Tax=Pseudanabaena biceps PCC 7429 TaxID=927668 RepID=L8MRP1_9CYAN|nr:DUF29 domain-containing protein [Pseudanabaena biceps]ELS30582.1 protein of unknown function DUF29 [Pseudanabaena biceps PCC 7429]
MLQSDLKQNLQGDRSNNLDGNRAINQYAQDFYAWTQEQSELLRLGQWQTLDIENLVEEILSLGRQQKQELRNRLGILIGYLLKWDYQPELRSKSWKATIREQRDEILEILNENPSLKPYLDEATQKGFRQGINLVLKETPLDLIDLPSECPYAIAQILDLQFPFE